MTAIRRRKTDRHSNEQAMAATGGGKIRSRRYHIASKPYAKSKQQQPGLISRVTDTVKSIVPSWLQKYFNNGEAAEVDEAVQAPEHNSQPLPPNGSEVGPPPLDGWDSSEPSTSHAEPSTSRASLNYKESSLSRPPLNRSNLHFPPLDAASPVMGSSSSPFTQPSTSTAPGPSTSTAPGPSTSMTPGPFSMGFSLVKEIKDNLSQHEDDNISTTSGFSSRASDKDVPTSKPTSIPRLWSPEMDRTNCGPQHAHSSLKKPAFNLSVFGTSSNSTLNSSVLTSSQLGDSPFYPGKTTYGGASAARSSRTRPTTPYQAPLRRQIKAKPAGTQPCGVTSATARRILQSLERMSSPLADAKRIPSANSSPMSVSMDGTNLDLSHFQSKKKRLDSPFPPVQKLVIPAAASISGNRSLSFRPSLTPGGVGRTLDRPYRDTPTRQSLHVREESPGPSRSTSSSSGPVYPLSSTPAATSTGPGGGGKMKRERTSTRTSSRRPEDEEAAEVPDLPAISLPISAFSLPILNFSTPPPPAAAATTPGPPLATPARQPVADQASPKASTPPCTPFTFSSPIVKASAAGPPSFSPSAGFTFSAPVAKMGPSMSNGKLVSPIVTLVKSATSNSTEEFEGPFKPAKSLKQGSVLDVLKAPGFSSAGASSGSNAAPQQTSLNAVSTTPPPATPSSAKGFGHLFKPPVGSWSCDVCLVQNKPSDTKCVACTAPQPRPPASNPSDAKPAVGAASDTAGPPSKTSAGFGTPFVKPAGTWDCDTCLVQNRPEAVKCVACETAKPGTGVKSSLAPRSVFWPAQTSAAPAAPPGAMAGFGDKFKKAEGAWECDTCMVENKAQDAKCVACMSAKPGASVSSPAPAPVSSAPALGFGDKFKKPEGAWDCDVCCVQNKADDLQCVACQTARPGAKVEPKGFGSSALGSAGSSALGSAGSGGFKFGATSESTSESGGFKFGGTHPDSSSTSGGFKFGSTFVGSTSDITSKDTSNSTGFKFGGSTEGFTFGAASTLTTDSADKKSDSGFKFGNGSGIAFGSGTSNTASKPSNGGFSFGLSKPDVTTRCTAVTAPPATFTLPASCQMTIGSGASSTDSTSTSTTTATTTSSSSGASVFSRLGESSRTATPLGGATFSSLTAEKEPAAATFTFGKPEEKEAATSASTAAPAGFMFSTASKEPGNTSSTATLGGFSFNNPDPTKEAPVPAFTFGKPADKSERTAQDAPKPAFTFGQSAAETPAAPKAGFSFDDAVTTSSTPVPSLFGSSSTQAQAPTASPAVGAGGGFIFGSSASSSASDAASAKAFVFGQSQDGQTSTSPASAMNSSPAPATSQPFLFGAATNPGPPVAATPFAFGGAAPSAASSAATAAAQSPFVFSSAPSGGFGANQAPSSLGSPAPPAFSTFGCSSQAPAFGVKPIAAAPVFGQQTNPAPSFGAGATSTSGGGFQFGGASAFGACSTGVFSFGAGNTGSPAPPAVPSLTPQPPAAGGGFVFQQPPTFNIGSAKSSFAAAAPPAGTPTIAGRKIKTAVRRRK